MAWHVISKLGCGGEGACAGQTRSPFREATDSHSSHRSVPLRQIQILRVPPRPQPSAAFSPVSSSRATRSRALPRARHAHAPHLILASRRALREQAPSRASQTGQRPAISALPPNLRLCTIPVSPHPRSRIDAPARPFLPSLGQIGAPARGHHDDHGRTLWVRNVTYCASAAYGIAQDDREFASTITIPPGRRCATDTDGRCHSHSHARAHMHFISLRCCSESTTFA